MAIPRLKSDARWFWQLRVELLNVTPKVWRRVIVPSDITLPKLHAVLQCALGWTDSHLHEFLIGGVRYELPHPDDDFDNAVPKRDERRVRLDKALGHIARAFEYPYDFGDDWHHLIVIEDRHAQRSDALLTVQCIDGANRVPPEDVGGAPGYEEFLNAIHDPNHEEHARLLRWAGGSYDPNAFDIRAVNRELAAIKV
jgi:hypothetical protein